MMLKDHSIICFAPSDWWGMNPSCTTHIMKRLSRFNKVLYVNPFNSDLLGVRKGERKGFGQRFTRKLKSMTKWLKKTEPNLYIFSPFFIPVQGRKRVDKLNNQLLIWQIKLACWFAGIQDPLLWIENVRAADLLRALKGKMKVYHVSDLFCHDGYISNQHRQRDRENQVATASDVIICVSKKLYSLKKQEYHNVHYLPHGVDFESFQKGSNGNPMPESIRNIRAPIAGYFGTLTGSNDISLWEYCASQLPEISFLLIGRVTGGDYSKLKAMRNVYMPGFVPYHKIPGLCAHFDVCMLNWKMGPWIRSCNPLKMFEYMASSKPIVSVPIEEVRQYDDVISIAGNPREFCHSLQWELSHDTPDRKQKRIEIACQHDWGRHLSRLSEIIENELNQ